MVRVRMPSVDDFENDSTLLNFLSDQLLGGNLTILLGAGISVYFGLPSWRELIERLFASKRSTVPNIDQKRQAEYFRNKFYPDDKLGFLNAVKSALYQDVKADFDVMRGHTTLAAISSLVMASKRGSASEVITFNWDDLLEIYLEYHGFVTLSIGEEHHWSGNSDVTVLHPHGLLPLSDRRRPTHDIVFDQLSYTEVIGNQASPWRQLLLSIMRAHTCLFIGLSGNDDNLDSLLMACKQTHASVEEGSPYWGIAFTTSNDEPTTMFWKSRGVFLKQISDYDHELPQFLFQICQIAASKRA